MTLRFRACRARARRHSDSSSPATSGFTLEMMASKLVRAHTDADPGGELHIRDDMRPFFVLYLQNQKAPPQLFDPASSTVCGASGSYYEEMGTRDYRSTPLLDWGTPAGCSVGSQDDAVTAPIRRIMKETELGEEHHHIYVGMSTSMDARPFVGTWAPLDVDGRSFFLTCAIMLNQKVDRTSDGELIRALKVLQGMRRLMLGAAPHAPHDVFHQFARSTVAERTPADRVRTMCGIVTSTKYSFLHFHGSDTGAVEPYTSSSPPASSSLFPPGLSFPVPSEDSGSPREITVGDRVRIHSCTRHPWHNGQYARVLYSFNDFKQSRCRTKICYEDPDAQRNDLYRKVLPTSFLRKICGSG